MFRASSFCRNFHVTLVAMVVGPLHGGAGAYGLLSTVFAIGTVVGAIVAARSGSLDAKTLLVAGGAAAASLGVGGVVTVAAVLGGAGLRDKSEHSNESVVAHIVAAIAMAFVLAVGSLHHAIILSLTMFAALIYGAPFGYADWAAAAGWAAVGNMIGGIGLVSALRLLQAGKKVVEEQRAAVDA